MTPETTRAPSGMAMTMSLSILALLMACQQPQVRLLEAPPLGDSLHVEASIVATDSFRPSAAFGGANCDIILIGGEWGTIVRFRSNSAMSVDTSRLPGVRRGASAGSSSSEGPVVWSNYPSALMLLDLEDLSVDSVAIPRHPWGAERWVGPAVRMPDGRVALAQLGGMPGRVQPSPWIPAPLVRIVDQRSELVQDVGKMRHVPGRYLSWLMSRAAVGSFGDTLLVYTLSDAVLSVYVPKSGTDSVSHIRTAQLPLYFQAPEPREEIWQPAWIQVGGEVPHLIHVPHTMTAVFGPDGRLYAVRVYDAEWLRARNPYVRTQGRWRVARSALEVYDTRGALIGSLALPAEDIIRLHVDENGRIMMISRVGTVHIASSPFSNVGRCEPFSRELVIPVGDRAPKAVE